MRRIVGRRLRRPARPVKIVVGEESVVLRWQPGCDCESAEVIRREQVARLGRVVRDRDQGGRLGR